MNSGFRKESVVSDVTRTADELPTIIAKLNVGRGSCFWSNKDTLYPFSQVLRLRVLQIVCGILILLMGTVACIEDRGAITSLGLGIPAGLVTVLAAAVSIQTSRGFGGYRPSSCGSSSLRFLGPNPQIAAPLTALWTGACSLHTAVIVESTITFRHNDNGRTTQTTFLLAVVELILSTLSLVAVVWIVRIDCCYDPD